MKKYNNFYCKIFIDTDLNKDDISQILINLTDGQNNKWGLLTKEYEMDIKINDDFDLKKRSQFPDGFLYYRFYLDIEPTEGTLQENYFKSLSDLLESLWSLNYQVVAVCDFEEELPRKGGYKWQVT